MDRHIFLTGFMGSGKTTIGKKMSERTGWPFYDCDQEIERHAGRSIPEIFKQDGEHQFRLYERQMITDLVMLEQPTVIALGGGALLVPENLTKVKQYGRLIYLKSNPDQIWSRIRLNRHRPLLINGQNILSEEEFMRKMSDLMMEREKGYLCADVIIDRDGREAEEVVNLILERLATIN